jgi:hypothetical protein
MLLNNIQSRGLVLSVSHDKLVFESEHELLDEQVEFLKANKNQLMLEVVNAPEIEVIEGVYFPLHRLKNEDLPRPVPTDFVWIDEQLRKVDNRLVVASEYSRIYQRAFIGELKSHQKEGVSRFAANSWLLNYCEALR